MSLTFHGHTTQVKCCVFSKTGSQIASASFDHTARVWHVAEHSAAVHNREGRGRKRREQEGEERGGRRGGGGGERRGEEAEGNEDGEGRVVL